MTVILKYPLRIGTRKFDRGTECRTLDAASMADMFPGIKRNDLSNQIGIELHDGTRTVVDRKQILIP